MYASFTYVNKPAEILTPYQLPPKATQRPSSICMRCIYICTYIHANICQVIAPSNCWPVCLTSHCIGSAVWRFDGLIVWRDTCQLRACKYVYLCNRKLKASIYCHWHSLSHPPIHIPFSFPLQFLEFRVNLWFNSFRIWVDASGIRWNVSNLQWKSTNWLCRRSNIKCKCSYT